jgi:tRNA(Ile)-lysidine synthase TilS/MesJ
MQHIYSLTRRCAEDFNMIKTGDRIALGVSGGKDSLVLLCALAGLRGFLPERFELEAVTLDMGFDDADFSGVGELCESLQVRYTVIKTNIKQVVFDIKKEKNPCSLCAKLRRGALHNAALSLGCNKVALAHHYDDAIETFMLSLIYEGRISCFEPVTYLSRKGLTLIRPLLYVHESEIRRIARDLNLPIVHNPCPANGNTKRQEVKELVGSLDHRYHGFKKRLFGSMLRLPLPGWQAEGTEPESWE